MLSIYREILSIIFLANNLYKHLPLFINYWHCFTIYLLTYRKYAKNWPLFDNYLLLKTAQQQIIHIPWTLWTKLQLVWKSAKNPRRLVLERLKEWTIQPFLLSQILCKVLWNTYIAKPSLTKYLAKEEENISWTRNSQNILVVPQNSILSSVFQCKGKGLYFLNIKLANIICFPAKILLHSTRVWVFGMSVCFKDHTWVDATKLI